jgi:hypothetical protein
MGISEVLTAPRSPPVNAVLIDALFDLADMLQRLIRRVEMTRTAPSFARAEFPHIRMRRRSPGAGLTASSGRASPARLSADR